MYEDATNWDLGKVNGHGFSPTTMVQTWTLDKNGATYHCTKSQNIKKSSTEISW